MLRKERWTQYLQILEKGSHFLISYHHHHQSWRQTLERRAKPADMFGDAPELPCTLGMTGDVNTKVLQLKLVCRLPNHKCARHVPGECADCCTKVEGFPVQRGDATGQLLQVVVDNVLPGVDFGL